MSQAKRRKRLRFERKHLGGLDQIDVIGTEVQREQA